MRPCPECHLTGPVEPGDYLCLSCRSRLDDLFGVDPHTRQQRVANAYRSRLDDLLGVDPQKRVGNGYSRVIADGDAARLHKALISSVRFDRIWADHQRRRITPYSP